MASKKHRVQRGRRIKLASQREGPKATKIRPSHPSGQVQRRQNNTTVQTVPHFLSSHSQTKNETPTHASSQPCINSRTSSTSSTLFYRHARSFRPHKRDPPERKMRRLTRFTLDCSGVFRGFPTKVCNTLAVYMSLLAR